MVGNPVWDQGEEISWGSRVGQKINLISEKNTEGRERKRETENKSKEKKCSEETERDRKESKE